MTTKHTPGPWYVGSGTYEGRNIYSTASVTDGEGFTYQPVVATAEDDEVACWDANARLIAAAPDLLEALKDMVDLVELLCPFDGPQQRKARAAIARATGEQA